jgi:hypothetical protein
MSDHSGDLLDTPFYVRGICETCPNTTPNHAMPVGIASVFFNAAMTGASSYGLRNANARVSHRGLGATAIKSKRKTSKSIYMSVWCLTVF